MTHQYKQMQKEYNDELDMLNKTLQEREDELSKTSITIEKNNDLISLTKKEQD